MSFAPQRPTGVTVVAILEVIIAIFYISEGLLLITGAKLTGVASSTKLSADVGPFGAIILVLGVVCNIGKVRDMDQKAVGLDIRNYDFCFGDANKHHSVFLRTNFFHLGRSAWRYS